MSFSDFLSSTINGSIGFTEGLFEDVEGVVSFGGTSVSMTATAGLGYNPFALLSEIGDSVGDTLSSTNEQTSALVGIGTSGTGAYGSTVASGNPPKNPDGEIKDSKGNTVAEIYMNNETNISQVERNAEKVYNSVHRKSIQTTKPIIMADDPLTYHAADIFLGTRSPGMLLRMLEILDKVLTDGTEDTIPQ